MKPAPSPHLKFGLFITLLCLNLGGGLLFWMPLSPASAQAPPPAPNAAPAPAGEATPGATAAKPVVALPRPVAEAADKPTLPPNTAPANQSVGLDSGPTSDEIQLSFQGANIDMVVQWLAKTTGKSVVKHPRVQCQLTIVSSKKLAARDAINLVYRALALEGFTTLESSKSILIVPEGQEPKLSPELVGASPKDLPEGRQRLMKIFSLKHIQPAELRDKVRGVLSEKATIEVADRSSQVIITDYTDNLRLVGELIQELDVPSGSDVVIEFFSLKHSEAEDLGALLGLVLNSQPAPPASRSSSPSSASSRSSSPNLPGGPPSMIGGPGQASMGNPEPPSSGPPSSGGGAPAGQQVKIWPDKTSNRLIVAAQKSKMAEVQRLIDLLDTEKPRDVAIRVLPLKNVTAEDLVKDVGPLYQKMSGKSLKDVIEVTASSRGNALVILSSEENFKEISKLVASLDTAEAQEKVMQAFILKNAEAEDVAKQLQDLNQDQDSSGRYPYYIFSYSSMMGKSGKKASFVADRRRNTVIVQAPPGAMESIAKMIKELDEPVTDNGLTPKIFRLKYVSAADIEDVLNELFLKKQQQRSYWDPYGYPNLDTSDRQGGGGRLYGKIRITSEPYANAIIVTSNSPESLAAIEEVLKELDVPSQAGETTLRLALRFAKASTVANSINILFAKNGSPPLRQTGQPPIQNQVNQQPPQQQQGSSYQANFALEQETKEEGYYPWLGGQQDNFRSTDGRSAVRPVSDLVGRVRVVPDERSNSLLISANVHFFPQILKLIEEMDAPTAQVLIEAKIVEVSSDFLEKLGVRWSPNGAATFTADDLDNSILANVKGAYTKGFGPDNTTVAATLNSLRSGVVNSTLSLDFLVQFLRKTTEATVLAEPQVNIADNEMGKLFVGQQVPVLDNSIVTQVGGQTTAFKYKDVGVVLEVTPHINNSGDVALKIRTESSAVVPGQVILGGAVFDTRNFKTDLTVKNGQTLVLGGIIQRQSSDTLRKTPILGSIPGLGWLFKKKDRVTREVELMVFLRPKVVRTPEEAQELLDETNKKAPLIRKWQQENRQREGDSDGPTARSEH